MRQLDPRSFLADTLKPYATGGKPGLPGLFERYLLEPGDDDDDAIEARLREVKAIWSKAVEHPRYGLLAKNLAKQHADAELQLLDPSERRRLSAGAREQQAEAQAGVKRALDEWRKLVAEFAQQGGLTPNSRARLETLAAQRQIATDVAKRELDAVPVAAAPDLLSADVRKVIRTTLQTLAREEGEERLGLSLYHALGLPGITEDLGVVRAEYDRTMKETRARSHGQSATNYKSMLAQVKDHLLDNDPRAYLEGLKQDISEEMAFEAAQATTDGEIDPIEAEALLQSALTRGLNPELGRQLIRELARSHGAVVLEGERVAYVACPRCNTPHPGPDAPPKCKRCAAPLFVNCPRDGCGTRNVATAVRCSKCEADLRQYSTARRRLEALPDALREGRVAWAADEVREISTVLGADAIPAAMRSSIDAALKQAVTQWSAIETALVERRLYAARAAVRGLVKSAPDVLGPGTEDSPAARVKEIDERLADVDTALARARSASGAAREAALIEALSIAADCAEAERALASIPPLAPANVDAALQSTGVAIRWAASRTAAAQYAVRRVDESSGASHDLGTTNALHLEDLDAPIGAFVRYDVATVRGPARSQAARSNPVLVAREVQRLSVSDLDGEVRLTWSAVPSTGRVRVTRRTESSGGKTELMADRTGMVDRDVTNGERYAYRVTVEYAPPGAAAERTPGLTVYGQPAPPPEGIDDVRVSDVPGGVLVSFPRPAMGTVTVLRCDKEPTVTAGESLNPATIRSLGQELSVGSEGARDTASSGVCWYLPVTVSGGVAVAGRAVRHLALAPLTNVSAAQSATEVKVTWEWPDAIKLARVLWRHDQQPIRPDDPESHSAWVRKGEYRDNGGFSIESRPGQAVFVAVVSGLFADGERISGTAITKSGRAAVRAAAKTGLTYSVRRAGMRKKRLEVEVDVPAGAQPPAMLLVGRGGDLLPRTAGEGQELARLGGDQPLTATVDISSRERPLTVRLFLATASASSVFVLTDPGIDELLIR